MAAAEEFGENPGGFSDTLEGIEERGMGSQQKDFKYVYSAPDLIIALIESMDQPKPPSGQCLHRRRIPSNISKVANAKTTIMTHTQYTHSLTYTQAVDTRLHRHIDTPNEDPRELNIHENTK